MNVKIRLRIKNNTLILLVLFVLIGTASVYAQEFPVSYSFVNYNVNQGLPSSEIYDLYQDPKKGVIWIATDRGLVKYDGYQFTTYSIDDGLTDNVVLKFTPDKFGNIWCHTLSNKLCYIDPEQQIKTYRYNNTLTNFKSVKSILTISLGFNEKGLKLTSQNILGWIKIGSDGKLSASYLISELKTTDLFLNFLPDEEYYYISLNPETEFHFKIKDLRYGAVHTLTKNLFLVTDFNRIDLYREKSKIKTITKEKPIQKSGKLNDELFWVSFVGGGVDVYDFKGNLRYHFLERELISSVIQDHEGGIWFSSLSGGIFYLKNVSLKTIDFSDRISSFTSMGNEVYMGFYNGSILNFNCKTMKFNKNDQFKGNPVCLENSVREKKIYFSNYSCAGWLDYSMKNSLVLKKTGTPKVSDGAENGKHFFNSFAGFYEFENDEMHLYGTGFRTNDILVVDKRIFLAGAAGIYTYKNGIPKRIVKKELNYRFDDLDRFRGGFICASLGGGCVFYSKDTIFSIKKANGLLSDLCTEVFVENDSTVWLATAFGANKLIFDRNFNYTISSLSIVDGLSSNEVIDFGATDDYIWIVTKKGLSFMPKNYRFKPLKSGLFLSLENFTVNGKACKKTKEQDLELTYGQNNIEVFFSAISFNKNASLIYRYVLYPGEKKWSISKNQSVVFHSLSPGKYNLLVQASLDRVHWSDTIKQHFTINPPFWKTWWFLSLEFAVFFTFLFLLIRNRLRSQKRKIKLLETEMKAFRAQMNPHFIFNALSSIQNFILKGNIADSNKYLVKFSRLIRGVLENSKSELISIKKELEILRLYIEVEQIRVKAFDFEITVDDELNQDLVQIPPLLLQPFVENAIWHGFKNAELKGKLCIELKKEGEKLICTVDDNGVGRKSAAKQANPLEKDHQSLGLEITRERVRHLKHVYQIETGIRITDKVDVLNQSTGTTIVLTLPLIKKP